MAYFTNRKTFLMPSFDIDVKEEEQIIKFLLLLENSDVGLLISRYVKNDTKLGGRPNVNYYNLFAVILYGFAFGRDTLRDLADACAHDLRYIFIMEQVRPSYTTISNFINNVIIPNEECIFKLINIQIKRELNLDFEDAFIDGSKFEANANKYKFVWKPTTFHKRISITFFKLLKENNLCTSYHFESEVKSSTVAAAINELSKSKSNYENKQYNNLSKALMAILQKVLEYEEKESICGEKRASYYKTDHDATAMALKADYYAGLGTHMHAAYNVQILVIKGLVFAYYISQSRSDIEDFIPVLAFFNKLYDTFPKNICADSGYGSLENYEYLHKNKIGNYVKYISWEGNKSGSYPDSYRINDDDTITCLNGNIGIKVELNNRHPRKANAFFYKVENCINCKFKLYCMRYNKDNEKANYKIFEVIPSLIRYKQEAEKNLLSVKGIEIRVNRSIQVEGVYGIEKQNKQYTRFRRRGIKKVSTENMLVYLGMNISKLFSFYVKGSLPKYWIAPNDLVPQSFTKPSAKRLSKKGNRINKNLYKNKQA